MKREHNTVVIPRKEEVCRGSDRPASLRGRKRAPGLRCGGRALVLRDVSGRNQSAFQLPERKSPTTRIGMTSRKMAIEPR